MPYMPKALWCLGVLGLVWLFSWPAAPDEPPEQSARRVSLGLGAGEEAGALAGYWLGTSHLLEGKVALAFLPDPAFLLSLSYQFSFVDLSRQDERTSPLYVGFRAKMGSLLEAPGGVWGFSFPLGLRLSTRGRPFEVFFELGPGGLFALNRLTFDVDVGVGLRWSPSGPGRRAQGGKKRSLPSNASLPYGKGLTGEAFWAR